MNQINIELKETKELMTNNIKTLTHNLEDVQDLEKQSNKIKENANEYQKNAVKIRKATWWQNCKWWVILILVIILLLIIILPISLTSGKKDKDSNKKNKQ